MYRIRYDFLICLFLTCLVTWGAGKAARPLVMSTYDSYIKEKTVPDGDIGGRAGEDVFRAESVEDILSHGRFTFETEYRNIFGRGGGRYGKVYLHSFMLPSGEMIAAAVNRDSVKELDDKAGYNGKCRLPVGKVVYENLEQDDVFIQQIEYNDALDRRDFYIDMLGEGGNVSKDMYPEPYVSAIQLFTAIIGFPFFHTIGSKIGLFPYLFPPKDLKEKKSEWD